MSWFSRSSNKAQRKKPLFIRDALSFETLESRLLLSADAFGGVVDSDDMDDTPALLSNYDKIRDDLYFKLLQTNTLGQNPLASAETTVSVSDEDYDAAETLDLNLLNDFFSGKVESSHAPIKELVFVDYNTPDIDVLLEDALNDERIQVITIASNENALEFITTEIQKYDGLAAIHIMSHGQSGSLQLGGETFDQAFLSDQANQRLLSSWQETMAADADLLIYGCNFAEGAEGQSALSLFADVTGLNAAASDDVTGSYTFAGDWQLEYVIGEVDTRVVVGLDVQSIWDHSLATIVVNTTDDAPVFVIKSISTLLGESEVSLREAIQAINYDPSFGVVHTIEFQLDGDHTIDLSSQLPSLQRAMIIDGTSDIDFDGEPIVTINGNGNSIFNVVADNVEIRGFTIENGSLAISVSGDDNVIAGNTITTNSGNGIYITGSNNTIGGSLAEDRNLISGNGDAGIHINNYGANGNTIQGNWIGLAEDGSRSFGNSGDGITINTATNTEIKDNVISGNENHGVQIYRVGTSLPSGHSFLGNIIGLDASGTRTVGNGENGLELFEVRDITVGDGTESGRNIISGNSDIGVSIVGLNTDQVTVSGNYIGTDITGTKGFGNGSSGIQVYDGPDGLGNAKNWTSDAGARIYIGGDQAEEGNLISANTGDGILIHKSATYISIVNNSIGLDVTGTEALGNVKNGINVMTGLDSYGEDAQVYIQDNAIAYNIENGIAVSDSNTYGVYIFENQIYANNGLSIDLGDDGRTPNDPGDFDSGANRLLNFPEITSVEVIDGYLNIQGSLNLNSLSQGEITLTFYYAMDQRYSGDAYATNVIDSYSFSAGANSSFTYEFDFDVEIPTGAYVTASTLSSFQVGTSELTPSVQLIGQGNISNQLPTGEVSFDGALIQGAVLTAANTLADGNGINGAVQYQWRRNGVAIAGANEDVYTLTQDDVGSAISVLASYIDGEGYAESRASLNSEPVENVNDAVAGEWSIEGDRSEDSVLTFNHTLSDPDGIDSDTVYTYQWYRDGVAITDANAKNYTLTDLDVSKEISATVSFTDTLGGNEVVNSGVVGGIANKNDNPDGYVGIDGLFIEDQVLTALVDFTDDDGLPIDESMYTYQWYRDDVSILGADDTNYTLGDEDVGKRISAAIGYQDGHGASEVVYSLAPNEDENMVQNINDDPDGPLGISGSNVVGEELSAVRNFTDADGINESTVTYQWYRDNVAIVGEVSERYQVVNTDVDTRLSVSINYEDIHGTAESRTSAETSLVNSNNQPAVGPLTLDGGAVEDQVLSLILGFNDPDGIATDVVYGYQWFRDDVAIISADQATYQLTDTDVGHTIHAQVSYEDLGGSNEVVKSDAYSDIASVNDLPVGNVSISGGNTEGETVKVKIDLTDDDDIVSEYRYQWLRDGVEIVGENNSTYVLAEADVGSNITVMVSYDDWQGYTDSYGSTVFGPIVNLNQVPTGPFSIPSDVAENQTLTASITFSDVDGLPADISDYRYQWYRDGEAISSTDSADYVLVDADVGKQIHVQVFYTDGHGINESYVSNVTNAVSNVNDNPYGEFEIVGEGTEGALLTIKNLSVDEDGIETDLGYQWYRDGIAIDGEISDSYRLVNDDVHSNIMVRWQYIDSGDNLELVESEELLDIQNVNSPRQGGVEIDGDPNEDATLSIANTLTDEDGIDQSSWVYQWYRDGIAIGGATSDTYQLGDADVSAMLNVIVSYTDLFGTKETAVSEAFGEIIAVNDEPEGEFYLQGDFEEGSMIVLTNTVTDADGIPSDAQTTWYRDGEVVSSLSATEYLLSGQDIGAQISVQYTYTDEQGFNELVDFLSPVIANVNDLPSGTLVLSGQATEGELLQLSHNVTDVDGIFNTPTFQWYRDDIAIENENGISYRLTADDYGAEISASLDYVDGYGTSERVDSNRSLAVEWMNHLGQGEFSITGDNAVGSVLLLNHLIQDPDGVATELQFQWQRDGEAIDGAESADYQVSNADQGSTLSVLVSYTDARGFDEVLVSPLIEIPEPVPDGGTIPKIVLIDNDIISLDFGDSEGELTAEVTSGNDAEDADAGEDVESEAPESNSNVSSYHLSALFDSRGEFDSVFESAEQNTFVSDQFGQLMRNNRLSSGELPDSVDIEWVPTELTIAGVDLPNLNEMINLLNEPGYNKRLDDSVDELQKDNVTLTNTVIGGTAAASTGLSVGYLLWTLRSGVLMTSLLSSMPAWRFMDPLPILGGDSKKTDEDEETLESMLEAENAKSKHREVEL